MEARPRPDEPKFSPSPSTTTSLWCLWPLYSSPSRSDCSPSRPSPASSYCYCSRSLRHCCCYCWERWSRGGTARHIAGNRNTFQPRYAAPKPRTSHEDSRDSAARLAAEVAVTPPEGISTGTEFPCTTPPPPCPCGPRIARLPRSEPSPRHLPPRQPESRSSGQNWVDGVSGRWTVKRGGSYWLGGIPDREVGWFGRSIAGYG